MAHLGPHNYGMLWPHLLQLLTSAPCGHAAMCRIVYMYYQKVFSIRTPQQGRTSAGEPGQAEMPCPASALGRLKGILRTVHAYEALVPAQPQAGRTGL